MSPDYQDNPVTFILGFGGVSVNEIPTSSGNNKMDPDNVRRTEKD